MHEQLQTLRTYLRMAWLYRWMGVTVVAVSCMLGWFVVQTLPDEYRVSAKIYLDSSSMLRPLLRGIAVSTGGLGDTALILNRTLLTRPNLEEVIRRADLDLTAKTPEEFDTLIDRLSTRIQITTTKRDNIYDISYVDSHPKVAKAVVSELLNTFMESSLGDNRRESAVTQRFLEEQIGQYEKRLIEAEDRLKEFRQRNVAVMPGSQGGYFNRLQETQNQLKQAQLDLEEGLRRSQQLHGQLESGASAPSEDLFGDAGHGAMAAPTSPEIQADEARILELQRRIDDLLLTYTEKYPDIVSMRQTIVEIEKRKEAKLKALAEQPVMEAIEASGPTTDPYAQQLKLQVAEADAQVAALQTRVQEYERRMKDLEHKVDTVPEVEAELVRLNRDYEVNKRQYDELLKRRELAYLAQEASQTEDEVKIKVLEPPRLPLAPSGPNRALLASVVLLVGLGAGAAVTFILSQLNPRIVDLPDLRDVTGLPVLGALTMNDNFLYRRQRAYQILSFSGALAVVVLVYMMQLALAAMGIDLHIKISSLIGTII